MTLENSLRPARQVQPLHVGRAFRVAIIWQSAAIAALAVVAGLLVGLQGSLSAILGGGIGIVGVLVFALMSGGTAPSAERGLRVALRAEAVKIVAIVLLLWLSFAAYHDMVVMAFFSSFMISVLLAGIASAASSD